MEIRYRKKFLKELSKIPLETRRKIENFVFETLPHAHTVDEIESARQMRGHPNSYKVRFGSYRLGFKIRKDIVTVARILHRRDIYRYFP